MASVSGTIYTGFTNNLIKRVWEHKNNIVEGFTKKYQCHKLVYYEASDDYESALAREKQIKSYNRLKKENLIRHMNPGWKDLYEQII
jgi:putative endonuclease